MTIHRLLWLCASLTLALTVPVSAGSGPDPGQILNQVSPALVTVQIGLQVKVSGALGNLLGEAQDLETETACPIIDPKGLILCSNTQINGSTAIMQRVVGRMGSESQVTAAPARVRVLVAGGTKPLRARVLMRDTDLDLAWLQIEDAGDQQFPSIDFEQGAVPRIGETVFAIRRLDRFFDRAPAFLETKIGGVTQKPRLLYIPAGGLETNFGLPVLTAEGRAVGLLVLQLPDESGLEEGSAVSLKMMSWSARMQDVARAVVLPAQEVVKATRRAMASLATDQASQSP